METLQWKWAPGLSFKDVLVGLLCVCQAPTNRDKWLTVVSVSIPKHLLASQLTHYLWLHSAVLTPPPTINFFLPGLGFPSSSFWFLCKPAISVITCSLGSLCPLGSLDLFAHPPPLPLLLPALPWLGSLLLLSPPCSELFQIPLAVLALCLQWKPSQPYLGVVWPHFIKC